MTNWQIGDSETLTKKRLNDSDRIGSIHEATIGKRKGSVASTLPRNERASSTRYCLFNNDAKWADFAGSTSRGPLFLPELNSWELYNA